MATTPIYGLRYQTLADAPDGAALGKNLAEDVESELQRIDNEVNALQPTTAWATYLPNVFGAGSGTFTTRSGRWRRIGPKTVAFSVHFVMATDGSGALNVNIGLPSEPARTIRQTFSGYSEMPGAVLQAICYTTAEGGTGVGTDRIIVVNSSITGNLNGSSGNAPLTAGQEITISGVYEEA